MNLRKSLPTLLLIAGWFLIGWFARGLVFSPQNQEAALFQQAQQSIAKETIGELPQPRQMTYAAIRGMLSGLGDKYAVFYEPVQAAREGSGLRGTDGAVGLTGELLNGIFTITGVTPDGPAARAGLKAGDILREVDGWPVRKDSAYMEIISMIRGPVGSSGQLVVQREGQTMRFTVPRAAPIDVMTQTLSSGIAYLRVDRFTDKTPQQVKQALESLQITDSHGLIWDLRYNGGGLMGPTGQVLDLFLEKGIAFHARTKDGKLLPYYTNSGGIAEQVPLAVLIGAGTYSASEVAAASILDRERGTLIGETTHGKGMITNTILLQDGSALHISVAQSLSPIHQEWYEGRGVAPQIVVKQDPATEEDTVLKYAVDYLQRR